MDFGENLKTFNLAHEHGVTSTKFVQNTHFIASAGRDNAIRLWDGDKYRLIWEY